MFTRSHFEATAKILLEARGGVISGDGKIVVARLTEKFAQLFEDDNSLFDRARFFAASGHVPGLTITEV